MSRVLKVDSKPSTRSIAAVLILNVLALPLYVGESLFAVQLVIHSFLMFIVALLLALTLATVAILAWSKSRFVGGVTQVAVLVPGAVPLFIAAMQTRLRLSSSDFKDLVDPRAILILAGFAVAPGVLAGIAMLALRRLRQDG